MRRRTAVALAVLLVALVGTAVLALGAAGPSDRRLVERWASDATADTPGNHHGPAVASVGGRPVVFAPLNGLPNTSTCRLTALDATTGSAEWRYGVRPSNCTVHAVADPTVADYDGDGTTEVLTATTGNEVVAANARTGAVETRFALDHYGYTRPVVADLLGDAKKEVVAADVTGSVHVFRADGSTAWSRNLSGYTWGQPAVADFDADGAPELVAGFDVGQLHLFERDGTAAWPAPKRFDTSITWMTTGQADDDPAVEVVVAGADGTVAAVDGRTKQTEWRHDFGKFAAVHAFGDADDDGQSEVYATARDGTLRSIGADDGRVEWTTTLTSEDVPMTPPPTLGDPDGDGERELVAAANDGTVAVVDPATGSVQGSYDRQQSILTRPRLADLDGDGDDEVLVTYAYGRVVALDYARCDATDGLGCVFG